MELQEIEVTIDQDGKVRIAVRGVKGSLCLELTRALEEALGGLVESREFTSEGRELVELPIEIHLKTSRKTSR